MEEALARARVWLPKEPSSITYENVETAFTLLESIQQASGGAREEVLSVPLEDMKILSQLMKIIVVFGLWPRMDPLTIPSPNERSNWPVPPAKSTDGLKPLVHRLNQVISRRDDISDILLISPFLLDILAASVYFEDEFMSLTKLVPTYRLYQLLTKLIPSISWFHKRVTNKLSRLPVERPDSLRCLLEFVTGFRDRETFELGHLDKAVAALAAFPSGVPPKEYVDAVGSQLYSILSSTKLPEDLASSAGMLSGLVADFRPPLVGPLRDRIVDPFFNENCSVEPSLIALSRLPTENSFFHYLSNHLIVAVWLLVNWLQSHNIPNSSTLNLIRNMLKWDSAVDLLISSIDNQTWFKHLGWTSSNGLIVVSDTVFTKVSSAERLDLFITLLAKSQDSVVTKVFVRLIHMYPSSNPEVALQQARILERIGTELKDKLFGDRMAIVDLCSSLLQRPHQSLDVTPAEDSDDDDDSDGDEDYTLEELSLNLLSGLLMEGAVDEVTTQRDLLKQKARSPVKQIREKATYCLTLLESLQHGSVDTPVAPNLLEAAKGALQDPLVPARAHGLHMVGELVRRKEISVDNAMDVYLKELCDDDSFIYLNAIKGIQVCANQDPAEVVKRLLTKSDAVETTLRKREALTRVIQQSPEGALGTSTLQLITNTLLADIRVTSHSDIRLRVSAVSLLGWLVSSSPHSLTSTQESDAVDCAIGILRHETLVTDELGAALRRGAVVLALEISNVLAEGGFQNISSSERSSLITILDSVASNDDDEIVREHALTTLRGLRIN